MPLDFPDQRCVPYFRDEIDAKNVCNSYPGQCKEGFLKIFSKFHSFQISKFCYYASILNA